MVDKATTFCCLEVQLIAPPLSMTTPMDRERRVVVSAAPSDYEKTVTVVRKWDAHEPYVIPEERVPLR
jgi:hypothetical protein